jgi:hypothetical protein
VGIHYAAVILAHEPDARAVPALTQLAQAGRLIRFPTDDLIERLDALTWPDVIIDPPSPALRVRHILKDGHHVYFLFNEERQPLTLRVSLAVDAIPVHLNAVTGETEPVDLDHFHLDGHELAVLIAEERP